MNPLADLSNQLLAGMLTHGYAVLALVLVLAAIGVPLPASLVATVAGTLLAEGELDLVPTLVVAVGACLVGDMAGFGIGRLGGREIARRHGRWFGIGATRMSEAEALFRRWSGPTLFLSRSLLAIIGSAINLLAGASHLRFPIFVGYALLGRVLWVAVFVGLGYAFASSAAKAADFASSLSGLVGIAGVAVLLGLATPRPRKLSER